MNRSEQLNELFGALAKAQAEMSVAGQSAANPHYKSKFSSLTDLVRASRPALTKYGLAVTQTEVVDEQGAMYLQSTLGHSSGQWIESRSRIIPDKGDIQSYGKCLSYLQRYGYKTLVGVVSAEDGDDDDGESLMNRDSKPVYVSTKEVIKQHAINNNTDVPEEKISLDQLQILEHELKDHQDIVASILDTAKITRLRDLERRYFMSTLNRVRTIKAASK